MKKKVYFLFFVLTPITCLVILLMHIPTNEGFIENEPEILQEDYIQTVKLVADNLDEDGIECHLFDDINSLYYIVIDKGTEIISSDGEKNVYEGINIQNFNLKNCIIDVDYCYYEIIGDVCRIYAKKICEE